jgi:flagellar hook-associated protein 3 FlgL
MRISENQKHGIFVSNMQRNQQAISDLQRQLASSKRITTASEDPAAFSRSRVLESAIRSNEQFSVNNDRAFGYLSTTVSTLEDMLDEFRSVRTLLVSAGNETLTAADRARMATQVRATRDQLVQSLNTTWQGVYVFSGASGNEPAVVVNPDTSLTFNDSAQTLLLPIGEGLTVDGTLTTDMVVNPGGNDMFALIDSIISALEANDPDTLRTLGDSVVSFEGAFSDVIVRQAEALSRVEFTSERIADVMLLLRSELSELVDTNMVEAFSELQKFQTAYEALMAVQGASSRTSLLEYL